MDGLGEWFGNEPSKSQLRIYTWLCKKVNDILNEERIPQEDWPIVHEIITIRGSYDTFINNSEREVMKWEIYTEIIEEFGEVEIVKFEAYYELSMELVSFYQDFVIESN